MEMEISMHKQVGSDVSGTLQKDHAEEERHCFHIMITEEIE